MKKHLILLSLLYCTVGYGQEWIYTPFATTTPYPTKMKILKIGTVDMSLPENECPAKNWSFDAGDIDIPLFEYKAVKYNKGMMLTWIVAGWTMQELKAIEDSANGITYSFQIETWYDTVKPATSYTGLAGVKFDSARYYFRKYVNLRDKGVIDSLNPYKQKLINYNKK